MTIPQYLGFLNDRYRSGISREHSYRGDLENLIHSLVPEIHVTRKLSFEDILHYQKIIVALNETDRLMKEIDKVEFE